MDKTKTTPDTKPTIATLPAKTSFATQDQSTGRTFASSWYDPNRTLTHNALFNIVIGNRSCGKSYGLKKRVIKNFLDKGEQFVYLRRFKDEMDETKGTWFDDIIFDQVFPDVTIEYKNDAFWINGELAGYAMALTKAKDFKSSSYPKVTLIVFEEFIIEENGYTRYLKKEVEVFLGLYMSIDRYRGCKVFFLGNNYSQFNPYSLYWDIPSPYNTNITKVKKGLILLEMVQDPNFVKERLKTDFGQIIEGTPFAEYAIKNASRVDNKTFVMKKTPGSNYYLTFKYNSDLFGVWVDYAEGKFFVSNDVDPSYKNVYSFTLDDHTPNTLLLKSINKSTMMSIFIQAYRDGCVYFESMKIKSIVYHVIKLTIGG